VSGVLVPLKIASEPVEVRRELLHQVFLMQLRSRYRIPESMLNPLHRSIIPLGNKEPRFPQQGATTRDSVPASTGANDNNEAVLARDVIAIPLAETGKAPRFGDPALNGSKK